jgi:hypothetical protein
VSGIIRPPTLDGLFAIGAMQWGGRFVSYGVRLLISASPPASSVKLDLEFPEGQGLFSGCSEQSLMARRSRPQICRENRALSRVESNQVGTDLTQ